MEQQAPSRPAPARSGRRRNNHRRGRRWPGWCARAQPVPRPVRHRERRRPSRAAWSRPRASLARSRRSRGATCRSRPHPPVHARANDREPRHLHEARLSRGRTPTPRHVRSRVHEQGPEMTASKPSTSEGNPTTTLPEWPVRTIAVFVTVDQGPHAIPVSAPVRADGHTILLSLYRSQDSLARLRRHPEVALTVLAEGNIAFTARGTARVIDEPMTDAPDYAAVAIDVTDIDDHRQAAFTVEAGVERKWIDENEKRAMGMRTKALQQLAAGSDRTES